MAAPSTGATNAVAGTRRTAPTSTSDAARPATPPPTSLHSQPTIRRDHPLRRRPPPPHSSNRFFVPPPTTFDSSVGSLALSLHADHWPTFPPHCSVSLLLPTLRLPPSFHCFASSCALQSPHTFASPGTCSKTGAAISFPRTYAHGTACSCAAGRAHPCVAAANASQRNADASS